MNKHNKASNYHTCNTYMQTHNYTMVVEESISYGIIIYRVTYLGHASSAGRGPQF